MSKEINSRKKCVKKDNNFSSSKCAHMHAEQGINTDPFGSFTGVPTDSDDPNPVQDVDDL